MSNTTGFTRLRDSWTAKVIGTLGVGAAALVGQSGTASASPSLTSAASSSSSSDPCPPRPGDNASSQEREDYAVALYIGCDEAPEIPWTINNWGNITGSTYYQRHAVQVMHAINENSEVRSIFENAGIGAACGTVLKGTPYASALCVAAGVSKELMDQISESTFEDAAEQNACVKETTIPWGGVRYEVSNSSKYCLGG